MNKERLPAKVFIPKNPRKFSEGFEVVEYSSIYQIPYSKYTDKTIFVLETVEDWAGEGTIKQLWWKKCKGRWVPLSRPSNSDIPKPLKMYSLLV